jgi:hypothetical protein
MEITLTTLWTEVSSASAKIQIQNKNPAYLLEAIEAPASNDTGLIMYYLDTYDFAQDGLKRLFMRAVVTGQETLIYKMGV